MSSYVFQFFCGPEGIALANPGRARTRPALAGPPPRATAELVFEDLVRPAARLQSASADQERPRSPSRHRRARDRERRHHRRHRRPRSASGHRRRHRRRRRTPHQQPVARRPTASPPDDGPPGNGKHRRKGHRYQTPCCASWHVSGAYRSFSAQATGSATVSVQTGNASLSQLGNEIPVCTAAKSSWPQKTKGRTDPLVPLDIMNRKLHLLGNLSPLRRCKQPSSWPQASSRSKLCSKMS